MWIGLRSGPHPCQIACSVTESGPFKGPELRAAARTAIAPSALVKGVFEGYADPGAGLFGPAVPWAEGKRVKPAGRAEPARPDGTSVTLATYDNRPELPEAAQVVQRQLQKAGFTVKLEVREYSRLESDALAGKFDAFIGARNSLLDTGDPVGVLGSDYTCDGGYNLARLCDEKADRAVAEAVGTDGTGERQDAAMAAEAAILGTDAVVPPAHQRIIAASRPRCGACCSTRTSGPWSAPERVADRPVQAGNRVSITQLISTSCPGKVSSVTPRAVLTGRWAPKYARLAFATASAFRTRSTAYSVWDTIWLRVTP